MLFPWLQTPKQPQPTPEDRLLTWLREGVPCELACRATGVNWDSVKDKPEAVRALAEGEILLFERARDSGVTGTIRAAMRHETKTWNAKTDVQVGFTLEDYLKD
jgi:hypothetical protein